MQGNVLVVNCGTMGVAMLGQWLKSTLRKPGDLCVVEQEAEVGDCVRRLDVNVYTAVNELSPEFRPRMVLIGAEPQVTDQELPFFRVFAPSAIFVSIAAGIPMTLLERYLGYGTPIMRCMPNTLLATGKGMLLTFANSSVSQPDFEFVTRLLEAGGRVTDVQDEALMEVAFAISRSIPAHLLLFIEGLTDAAILAGLPEELAARLATQTVVGAGGLMETSTEPVSRLRENITKFNGAAWPGLDVLLHNNRLKALVTEEVEAIRERSLRLCQD